MPADRHAVRAALLGLGLTLALPSAADSVEAMCRDLDRGDELCACAAERLRERVGDADYELYREVGAAYLRHLDEGMAMGACR